MSKARQQRKASHDLTASHFGCYVPHMSNAWRKSKSHPGWFEVRWSLDVPDGEVVIVLMLNKDEFRRWKKDADKPFRNFMRRAHGIFRATKKDVL